MIDHNRFDNNMFVGGFRVSLAEIEDIYTAVLPIQSTLN